MNLHDVDFERGLRRRVRAEVRASRRFRSLRPRRFWPRHWQLPIWSIRWLLPVLVLAPFMGEETRGWAVESTFALAALLLAGIHAAQARHFSHMLTSNPDTPLLRHFTADESLGFRWCWRSWWHRPLWAAYDAASVLTVLNLLTVGPRADWPAIATLAVLHGLLSIGWTTRLWSWFDKTLVIGTILIVIVGLVAGKFTTYTFARLLAAIEPATLAFPSGWLVRAFAEWRSASGIAWTAAFACIAAIFAGLHFRFRAAWQRSFHDIWDSAQSPGADGGDEEGADDETGFSPAQPAVSPAEINACTEAVRGRDYLEIAPASPSSAIARLVAASLTARERLLVETFSEGVPDYPGTWWRAANTQIKWWLAIALFHWLGLESLRSVCLFLAVLQVFAILPVGGFLPRLGCPSNASVHNAELVVALPVALRELPAIERKLGWPFLLAAIPWCALVGAAVAAAIEESPVGGAILGAKAALLAAASRPLFRCLGRSGSSGCGYLLFAVVLLFVALVGAGAFMAAPHPWNLAAIAAVWLPCQWLWLEYARRWNKARGTDA